MGYFHYKTHSISSFKDANFEDEISFDIVVVNQLSLSNHTITQIKELQNKDSSKVVVLSEFYSGLSSEIAQELSIDAYLKMPFNQQNILNMIVELYVSKNLDKRSRKKTIKDKLKELSAKNILVAEDNVINHKVILGLLSQTKIEATFVANGVEALNLLNTGMRFDLILMDVHMPIISGYEASKEIRKIKKYNNTPILAFTADMSKEANEKALASGMQGYISKPIIIESFYKKLLNILKTTSLEIITEDSDIKDTQEYKELSIATGLNKCDEDEEFYKLILKDFIKMYQNSNITIDKLCKKSHFKEARGIAMDIKEVALNIGAYNLCESAAAMEYEFEKGSGSNWKKLINLYGNSLENLIKDINSYLGIKI